MRQLGLFGLLQMCLTASIAARTDKGHLPGFPGILQARIKYALLGWQGQRDRRKQSGGERVTDR